MKTGKKGCTRFFLTGLLALSGICLALLAVSALINSRLPTRSTVVDRLTEVDKARLAEVFHLRQALGDEIMPGWDQADIPIILYNEEYLFLVGLPDPADGWVKVPQGNQLGGAWTPMPGDEFLGQPYYRQPLPAPNINTQAFTVRVGDAWVASLAPLEWMRISLAQQVGDELPGPLRAVAPWFLMQKLLLPNSDVQMMAVLHEAMHAYQGIRAPQKLAAAEQIGMRFGDEYEEKDSGMRAGWQTELNLLHQALRADDNTERARLAREFLAQRAARRNTAQLTPQLVELERLREWEEGIAKYAEISMYRLANQRAGQDYQPLPELAGDPEFNHYRGAPAKWNQEIDQLRLSAGAGDGRFYYTGFAQAVLLDSLAPGWKERLFEDGVWLEDLLAEAVSE